jgi:hypothetical protein
MQWQVKEMHSPFQERSTQSESDVDRLLQGMSQKAQEKMKLEKIRKKYTWKSCCFQLDARFTVFSAQFLLTFMVLLLCLVELHRSNGSCEAVSFYGNVLTTLIGLWMPSPLMPK